MEQWFLRHLKYVHEGQWYKTNKMSLMIGPAYRLESHNIMHGGEFRESPSVSLRWWQWIASMRKVKKWEFSGQTTREKTDAHRVLEICRGFLTNIYVWGRNHMIELQGTIFKITEYLEVFLFSPTTMKTRIIHRTLGRIHRKVLLH